MGAPSSIMRPQELVEFRKLNTSIENVDIPARPENRTVTDKKGFVIFGTAIVILIPFLIYTLVNVDIRHLTHGTDGCGDFCGIQNTAVSGISCSGKNLIDKPYQEGSSCVEKCENGVSWLGRCALKENDARVYSNFNRNFNRNYGTNSFDRNHIGDPFGTQFQQPSNSWGRHFNKRSTDDDRAIEMRDFNVQLAFKESREAWWKYVLSIIFTIALGLLTLVLLRFVPAPLVWGIIFFSMAVLVVITGALWYGYFQLQSSSSSARNAAGSFLAIAVVWTIIAVIILIVFIVLFKRIGLVVQLYKETTKVLAAMPLIMFVPVAATFFQIIVLGALIITTIWMLFSLELVKIEFSADTYTYELSGVALFTICINIFIAIWALRFIAGIHYMTVSGSVARWYFAKNKDYLDSPICSSFGVTMKFHLGTIAFGSFLITLFAVVKAILRATCRNACCRCLVNMCCSSMEIILKFISENSYIQTAIHGQSYLRSARRATKLLLTNAASVIAINCVGDFVLGVIVLLVSILATAISFALFMNIGVVAMIPTFICFIVNVIIISVIFATFQTIIDSLFICFCEDSVLNDGMARPYFMSRGLMEFVENSKKLYGKKDIIR